MGHLGRLLILSLFVYCVQSHGSSCGCPTCQNSCSNCPLPEVSKRNLPPKNKDWVSSPFLIEHGKYRSGCDRLVCADPDAILFVRGKSLAYLTCSRKQWAYGRFNELSTSTAFCALPPSTSGCGSQTCPPGPAGPTGAPGLDGSTGAPGLDGSTGAPGLDGSTGAPGLDGSTGAPGLDGSTGAPGLDGSTGAPGLDGSTGAPGLDGSTGAPGVSGPPGQTGPPGSPGQDGIGKDGKPGAPGSTGAPGAPGVCPDCRKGCPKLVSIYVPEEDCISTEWDCNQLPLGTTTSSFVCPNGNLASREVNSNVWKDEGTALATCSAEDKDWTFDNEDNRLYACLSPSKFCGYSEIPCKKNFFCHGSSVFESKKNPKKIECSKQPTYKLYSASSTELTQPQVCTNGKWTGNNDWHTDVFCGYPCDKTCAFKKDPSHTAPYFTDPQYSEPDAEHTCPWAQCKDGSIYAWSGVQYERIPFLKAQCAKGGDANLPWVIGSKRFASIQCYNGPTLECKPINRVPNGGSWTCGTGQSCKNEYLLENTIHVDCDQSTLYASTSAGGPGLEVEHKLTCYDGEWHGIAAVGGAVIRAAEVYATCGPKTCVAAVRTNDVCPKNLFCDPSPLNLTATATETFCKTTTTLYVNNDRSPGKQATKLTCSTGIWTGTAGGSATNWPAPVFATCTHQLQKECPNPIKTEVICPQNMQCDMGLLVWNAETSRLTCSNGKRLIALKTATNNGGQVAKDYLQCYTKFWKDSQLTHFSDASTAAHVTCEK